MDDAALVLLRALPGLLGLGLFMGFSPGLYALVIHLLTRTKRPGRTIGWISVGVALACTALLLISRLADPETVSAFVRTRSAQLFVHRTLDLSVGALFLLAAAVVYARRRHRQRPARMPRQEHEDKPLWLVLLSFADTALSLAGLATMYVTGRVLAAAGRHATSPLGAGWVQMGPGASGASGAGQDVELGLRVLIEFGGYGIFLLAVLAPYLLMAAAWDRLPRLAARITAVSTWLVSRNERVLLAIGLAVAGAVFIWLGLSAHHRLPEW